jgi:RNA polymerase sigma-70 factor, ECF subfamily
MRERDAPATAGGTPALRVSVPSCTRRPPPPASPASRAPGTDEITALLRAWSAGDEQALLKLTPLVYAELRRRSRRYMAREPAGHLLQTTALINEVYLRLVDLPELTWQDRTHFFAVCARLMRQILTDLARARSYQKRGPGAIHVSLEEALPASEAGGFAGAR